ncbi:hypothetical protein E4U55_004154 [Claviceps digitariae]|nr:hypothetical protein E4U55_004154 [Claviceps digitariae]
MLSSPSRTPIKGHNDFCSSSESVPRSPGDALTILAKSNVAAHHSPAVPLTAASESRSGCPEAYPTMKQLESSVRISAVSDDHSTSDGGDDEQLLSSMSNYTPESLQAQRRMLSLTGDKMSTDSPEPSSPRPGSWYMGRNKNNVDQHIESQTSTSANTRPTQLRLSPNVVAASTLAPAETRLKPVSSPLASRFSFFNMTGFKGLATTSPVSVPGNDELINLDIDAALSSAGTIQNGESLSPAAFKNFHVNAAGLLRKFQSAYQDKAIACHELRAERDSQQDEKLELETRTTYLKIQLDDMAQKAAETEMIMQALMQELNQEKKLRLQERAARESIVMSSGISTISEDLGAEDDQRRKHHRQSNGTMRSDDVGFDTDEESIDQISLFSRSRSPPLTASSLDGPSMYCGSISSHVPQMSKLSMLEPPRPSRQSQPQQISTFQKLMKGISGDSTKRESMHGCQNCQGQDASVAWDTASLLRDENRGLKERVSDLEAAIDGALDAVMGVKL